MARKYGTRLTFQRDEGEEDADDREFHQNRHRVYRAAVDYVNGSLRDGGWDPSVVRENFLSSYARTVHRTYVRIYAKLHGDPGTSAPADSQ